MKKFEIKQNYNITMLSGFKTPAQTRYYYEINSEEDIMHLGDLGRFCEEEKLNYYFISAGTNTCFGFDLFNGLIIKNNLKGYLYNDQTKILECYSNEYISNIASKLKSEHNNDIWSRFIGLPGAIGGAIFGNAGCFGLEVENNFLEALVYNMKTGQIETLNREDMCFSYRSSVLKENDGMYFVIKAKFDLSRCIEKYSSDVDPLKFRHESHPKGLSCGSFFKNPNKENSAGKLIELVGLKGKKQGGAFFSEKHANFLMSDGTAIYTDIEFLMSLAISEIKKEKGIELIPEVRILKNK